MAGDPCDERQERGLRGKVSNKEFAALPAFFNHGEQVAPVPGSIGAHKCVGSIALAENLGVLSRVSAQHMTVDALADVTLRPRVVEGACVLFPGEAEI